MQGQLAAQYLSSELQKNAGGIGSTIGGGIGKLLKNKKAGKKIGRGIGKIGGNLVKIFGGGDYGVAQNQGQYEVMTTGNSRGSSGNEALITRTDWLCTISSGTIPDEDPDNPDILFQTTAFNNQTLAINPGLLVSEGGTFTWLPPMANAYQTWRPEAILFDYVPISGLPTGQNTALATVSLAVNYNVSDPPYTTLQEAMNTQWHRECTANEYMTFPIECKDSQQQFGWYNIRNNDLKSTQDQQLYDLGTLNIMTIGCQQENQPLGDLRVTYQIRLNKHQSFSPGNQVTTGIWNTNPFYSQTGAFLPTLSPLGTDVYPMIANKGNTFNVTFDYVNQTITFPPFLDSGIFQVTIVWNCSFNTGTPDNFVFPLLTGAQFINELLPLGLSPTTSINAEFQQAVTATNPGQSNNVGITFYMQLTSEKAQIFLNNPVLFQNTPGTNTAISAVVIITELNYRASTDIYQLNGLPSTTFVPYI